MCTDDNGLKKKLLQQKRDDARRFLKFLHPELGVGMSCFPLLLFIVTWLGGGYVLKSEKECRIDRMQNAGSASILGLYVVVLRNRKLKPDSETSGWFWSNNTH